MRANGRMAIPRSARREASGSLLNRPRLTPARPRRHPRSTRRKCKAWPGSQWTVQSRPGERYPHSPAVARRPVAAPLAGRVICSGSRWVDTAGQALGGQTNRQGDE
jgi:hypothetical protein